MAAYAILDIEVFDIGEYLKYQKAVAPLLREAGATYLARGGEFRIYEGDYEPCRLIIVEFPSLAAMDAFYHSEPYQALMPQRDACSRSRIVAVEGLDAAMLVANRGSDNGHPA